MSIVTFEPRGRLGNQMFQAAAALAYSLDHGKEFRIPSGSLLRGILREKIEEVGTCQPHLPEKAFHYNPLPAVDGNVRLFGYFQSWRYFWHRIEEVRNLFRQPNQHDRVCVHVRRGDYVGNKHFSQYGEEYYLKAIDSLPWERPGAPILWVGDDFGELVRLSNKLGGTAGRYSTPESDLLLIAGARVIIGANSSFSLMAAIISGHNYCIFPREWFSKDGPSAWVNTQDLIPPGFTVI